MPSFIPKAPSPIEERHRLQSDFLSQIRVDPVFLALFESIPELNCFVKNRAGETMFVTSAWSFHHGFQNGDEMLLKTDAELTPGALASAYTTDDETVYRTGEPLLNRIEICIDDVGLPDWYVTNKFPLRNEKGEIIGIIGTSRACQGHAPIDSPNARITPATRLLRTQLTEFPEAEKLARICCLSTRHLQRCFDETFGISPRTYWMKCRIRAACEALRLGKNSISELAQNLGFCDQSSFTAHFKMHTGQTPRAFRTMYS